MGKHKAANSLANGQLSAAVGDGPSTSGRCYTVSMAVPGSIIDNTQNIEFATFVAGQVSMVLSRVAPVQAKAKTTAGADSNSDCHGDMCNAAVTGIQHSDVVQYCFWLFCPQNFSLVAVIPAC
jgi:hypothetical protein